MIQNCLSYFGSKKSFHVLSSANKVHGICTQAQLFMNVFGLGVDTSLQCFIAAEEMGISEEPMSDLDIDDVKQRGFIYNICMYIYICICIYVQIRVIICCIGLCLLYIAYTYIYIYAYLLYLIEVALTLSSEYVPSSSISLISCASI